MPGTIQRQNQKVKFWNIAKTEGTNAEITLYGDIYPEAPRDWWTNEKIEGQYITPEGFLEDLEVIKNAQNITIKLNSCGGDLYTGIAIHNALKSLSGHKTVIVEGIAASAASIIMCAGDEVEVYPGSLIMIHGVGAQVWEYMQLEDLKKYVKAFEAAEDAIAEIYAVKTGMKVAELRSMMTEETWMTGSQAVENGFADKVIGGSNPEMSYTNRGILMINGVSHNVSNFHIPSKLINNVIQQHNEKGGESTMNDFQKFLLALQNCITGFSNKADDGGSEDDKEKTGDEDDADKKTDPKEENADSDKDNKTEDLEASIQARIKNAVNAERARLKEIDELPAGISNELVAAAKYGDTPCDAKELALQALKKQQEANDKQLQNLHDDTTQSGADKVTGSQAEADKVTNESKKIAEAKAFAQQRKERKQNKK